MNKIEQWLNAIVTEDAHRMSVGSLRTIEMIRRELARQQNLQQTDCYTMLPPVEVRKKADKIGKEFKRKWEAKYVGFGDGSTIELWWRHQIEDAFGGNIV